MADIKIIRITFNEKVKMHADLLAVFSQYTARERNQMIINALAESFLYRNNQYSGVLNRNTSSDELVQVINQLGIRLASVETALSSQNRQAAKAKQVSDITETGSGVKADDITQDGVRANTGPESPPVREMESEPEMGTNPTEGDKISQAVRHDDSAYMPFSDDDYGSEEDVEIPQEALDFLETL